jgi:hypothetical protein
MKIQDLEIVEELRIKRADKHEIVKFGDCYFIRKRCSSHWLNITLVIIVLIVDLSLDV